MVATAGAGIGETGAVGELAGRTGAVGAVGGGAAGDDVDAVGPLMPGA